jgi:Caspase domain/Tetratricopeptide repeat
MVAAAPTSPVDTSEAIRIDPKAAPPYINRAGAHLNKGDYDRAIADANEAIRINPRLAAAYIRRGAAYALKGDRDRAIADLSEAMRIDPNDHRAFTERAAIYEAKGDLERAATDYRAALALSAKTARARSAQTDARTRLAALEARKQAPPAARPQPLPAVASDPTALGKRVALVIGNADYKEVGRLANPLSDARAIAASLRRLGFAEVIERYDLTLAGLSDALKSFGDKTADADWALIYFAGHGIEMGGVTYVIPVEAKLERDSHVLDETLPLDRLLAKVESARRLRLVILDACRNNPFAGRMVRGGGANRSIGRGLARLEPEAGVLVAYSAKHGTTAQDGAGGNSPFAEALLANLEEPGLEVQFMFRRVRDSVLDKTGRAQEPFLYGSLGSEMLFFKQAAR